MKHLIHILVFFYSFIVLGKAQKIDLDAKNVSTELISFPRTALPASVQTYSVSINGAEYLQEWGFNPERTVSQYSNLQGFKKVATDGQLRWVFEVAPVRFVGHDIKSSSSTSKDKAGRVTTTYTYWYELSYVYGMSSQLISDKGDVLHTENIGDQKQYTHKGGESGSYKATLDMYNKESSSVKNNISNRLIKAGLNHLNLDMNRQFGYQPTSETFSLYLTDSKKHPENEAFIKNMKEAKRLFESMKAEQVPDSVKIGLEKVMVYFKEVAAKYTGTEKADIKLRYGSYYNNAQICYYLDRPDESIEWAKKIIANDYDKKDGEKLIKENQVLKVFLTKHGQTSRRFQRLKVDKVAIEEKNKEPKN